MIKANIILDKKIWTKKIKKPENYFKKKLLKLSKIRNFKNKNHEFTILLTNNKTMKGLNLKFRNKNKTTDVLSFPLKINFKKKSAFGLGNRNQKSAKWVVSRIECCVQPIFRIFEISIFEKIY